MSPINTPTPTPTPDSGITTATGNKDELIRSVALILGVVAAVVAVVVLAVWISCRILAPREEREARLRAARQRRAIRRRLARDLGIVPMDVLGEGDVPRPPVMNMGDRIRRVEEEDIEMGFVGLGIRSPRSGPEIEIEIDTVAGPSRPPPARVR